MFLSCFRSLIFNHFSYLLLNLALRNMQKVYCTNVKCLFNYLCQKSLKLLHYKCIKIIFFRTFANHCALLLRRWHCTNDLHCTKELRMVTPGTGHRHTYDYTHDVRTRPPVFHVEALKKLVCLGDHISLK